jgi:hypothetical protein
MEAAGQIGLNIQLVPDGMALIGFTKDRRMAIIMYKEPGKDLELTKRFVRGRASTPSRTSTRIAGDLARPRAVIIGWIDNLEGLQAESPGTRSQSVGSSAAVSSPWVTSSRWTGLRSSTGS